VPIPERRTHDEETGLIVGEDGKARCWWHQDLDDYRRYHDTEWGYPVTDDRRLFEKICLEGFQAGLSWLTILRKRDGFRAAFADFDFEKVASFGDAEIQACLENAQIVRHRKKIESTINNANQALKLRDEFGSLAAYFWQFEPDPANRPQVMNFAAAKALATSAESIALSKDLKKRGWSFVGPTTVYAFMQAMGLVNDHLEGCWCRAPIEQERARLKRPG